MSVYQCDSRVFITLSLSDHSITRLSRWMDNNSDSTITTASTESTATVASGSWPFLTPRSHPFRPRPDHHIRPLQASYEFPAGIDGGDGDRGRGDGDAS